MRVKFQVWHWGINQWMTSPRTLTVSPPCNRFKLHKYRRLPCITMHFINRNSKNESSANNFAASWEWGRVTSRPAVTWYEKVSIILRVLSILTIFGLKNSLQNTEVGYFLPLNWTAKNYMSSQLQGKAPWPPGYRFMNFLSSLEKSKICIISATVAYDKSTHKI